MEKTRKPRHPNNEEPDRRQGRRYGVAPMRGQARSKVRYVEGTHPPAGCRFLD